MSTCSLSTDLHITCQDSSDENVHTNYVNPVISTGALTLHLSTCIQIEMENDKT